VNARRGMQTACRRAALHDRGRVWPALFVTTEGTTARGVAGERLGAKVDGVKAAKARYRSGKRTAAHAGADLPRGARDRDEAIRLLKRFGYIL
jgi:hypothetical protein